jgi:hypothetical protein
MTIAIGIAKQLRYKKEPSLNTAPASLLLGQLLRRTSSSLDLKKATYQSKEINPSYQVQNYRHGVRSVDGSIAGELSVGTYSDFIASALRQAWQAVVTTGAIVTVAIAPTTGFAGTITRSAGSFLTDGFKVGDVVRSTGWTTTGTNANARNFWITALTGTVMTGQFLDGVTLVPTKAAGDSVTIVQAGKKTWTPLTGHTNDSYRIEHWYADIGQSEVFGGCRVGDVDFKLPATGFAEVDFNFMGIDMTTGTAAYYTTTAAASTSGSLTAVNGLLAVNGVTVALVTGMNIKVGAGMTTGEVVGSNVHPDIFAGAVNVSGQLTVYFTDATMRDMFVNETEAALMAVFTTDNSATADFMGFTMSRIKVGGASKDDGEKGLVMTMPYQALLNVNGGAAAASLATTLSIQDSLAT